MFGIPGIETRNAIPRAVHQNEIKYSFQVQRVCLAPLIFLHGSRVPVLPPVRRMHVALRKRVNFSCERTREKVEEERCMQSGAADLEGNRS